MTDIIQQARDVLAKWRKNAANGTWDLSWEWSTFTSKQVTRDNGYIGDTDQPDDARLIVGTAGNPELLDAIDGLLASEQDESGVCHCGLEVDVHNFNDGHSPVDQGYPPNPLVERIAAAIVAADERMSA